MRKRVEEKVHFFRYRDVLTGLWNRTYFEETLKKLRGEKYKTVALIIGDIDGLKLINDTVGHAVGDDLLISAARIIRSVASDEMVSRIGSDEFAILLPQVDERVVESICAKIKMKVEKYNQNTTDISLSISLGYSIQREGEKSICDLFKDANNDMYRQKMQRTQRPHSDLLQTVMKMLEVRDCITKGHVDRVEQMSYNLGRILGLTENKINNIRLLAKFHDIGKVGISDHILFKSGVLNSEEYEEMKRHSEIGYRIAQSATELVHIADWILKHHERWDGTGYPLGLSGEEIPIECRILMITDSYDAMTNDRPYRKGMSHRAALEELRRCAGTQFDPQLVEKFSQIELDEFIIAV